MTKPTTDGEKALHMRKAAMAARAALPDTAHQPRSVLNDVAELPAMVLAALYDTIQAEG